MEATTRVTNVEELQTPDLPSVRERLLAPIDPRHLRTRVQGGKELSYYPIWVLVRCLQARVSDYKWEVVSFKEIADGELVVVHGRLTIWDDEGVESSVEQLASEKLKDAFIPAVETCVAGCLRRAMATMGLGIDVYLEG